MDVGSGGPVAPQQAASTAACAAGSHLSELIKQLARKRRRFGGLLRVDGMTVNNKQVRRLYWLIDPAVRKRRGKKRLKPERVLLHRGEAINEVWCMDFVCDSWASGRCVQCLTITHNCSHEWVVITLDHGVGGEYVTRVLNQTARFRGCPQAVRADLGRSSPAGQTETEHLYRKLQRHVPRRVPERTLVRVPGSGAA